MNPKLVLLSAVCVYLVVPAACTSLAAAAASAEGVGLSGASVRSKRSGVIYIQAPHGTIGAQSVHQVQPIAVVPVATIAPSYSFTDKIYNVFGGIASKFRAAGEFIRSLCGPRQYVLVNVAATTTQETTTSTTTPKCTTSTTEHTTSTTEHTTSTTEHTTSTTEHTTTTTGHTTTTTKRTHDN